MRIVQRLSSLVGWLAVLGAGVLTTLEATGVINDEWRVAIHDAVSWLIEPSTNRWQSALAGAGLALIAVALLVAQILPARTVIRTFTIDRQETGATRVTGPAIYRRIGHAIGQLDGVHTVTPVPHRRKLHFRVELIDSANAQTTAQAALDALTPDVWASLGIDPRPVDLALTYRRTATAVTRKETLA